MNIELFLAHADDRSPVLDEGLPENTVLDAPRPEAATSGATRAAMTLSPDALPDQRWAIVAPEGPAGDRLLDLVAPLRKKREEEQEAPCVVYRARPNMSPAECAKWCQRDYWDAVGRQEEDLPRYLLLLGGPELISWDLQQLLGGQTFIGRLAFPSESGYEAYIEKVLHWEEAEAAGDARVLFSSVNDGTRATTVGRQELMTPALSRARERSAAGAFPAREILEIEANESLLDEAAKAPASLLFSMSHGAGAPKDGWASAEARRALQGAMVLARKGELLTASDIASRPFLPGGV